MDHSVRSIFKSLSVPAQLWHLKVCNCLQIKKAFHCNLNPSLEILKIFEHISFGISDPTIFL